MIKHDLLTSRNHKRDKQRGFTLIELLIVVVIMGIIAGMAWSNYQDHVRDTRRSEAKTALLALASAQEKYFSKCFTYANAMTTNKVTGAGIPFCDGTMESTFAVASENRHYGMALLPPVEPGCAAGSCFLIEADPDAAGTTGLMAGDGKYRIDSKGRRTWDKERINNIDPATGGFRLSNNTPSLWAQRRMSK